MPKPTCAGPHPYRTPCSHSAISSEVSSQRVATGRTGEGGVTKGPGEVTWGDGISAYMVRQSPPLEEALTRVRTSRPTDGHADCRKWTMRVMRAAASRKWTRTMTGEALRRPTVGKPNL